MIAPGTLQVQDVWRFMPRTAGGPKWSAFVQRAIDYYAEWVAAARRTDSDYDDLAWEYADAAVIPAPAEALRVFAELELWAAPEISSRADDLGVTLEGGIARAIAQYVWVAAEATMQAVAAAAEVEGLR